MLLNIATTTFVGGGADFLLFIVLPFSYALLVFFISFMFLIAPLLLQNTYHTPQGYISSSLEGPLRSCTLTHTPLTIAS